MKTEYIQAEELDLAIPEMDLGIANFGERSTGQFGDFRAPRFGELARVEGETDRVFRTNRNLDFAEHPDPSENLFLLSFPFGQNINVSR